MSQPRNHTPLTYAGALVFALFLGGCVYKIDIQQGNLLTEEMVSQLKPGMTKRQVAYLMGNPLLVDSFHGDRWDFVYTNQPGWEERTQTHLTLVFKGDELQGLQGDFRPDALPSNLDTRKESTVDIPKIRREQTLWDKMKGLFSFGE
jgi:outer membrane protein assembly factor BamE